jgi:hypothetical protein
LGSTALLLAFTCCNSSPSGMQDRGSISLPAQLDKKLAAGAQCPVHGPCSMERLGDPVQSGIREHGYSANESTNPD